ncbi:hypothetical protein [Burkholderia stagnalis]
MGYVDSLLALALALREQGIGVHFATSEKSALVAVARNALVHYFITQTDATHLLFIDADMRFRAPDVMRLLEHGDRDVVGALYPGKTYDWDRLIRTAREQPDLETEKVILMGARYVSIAALEGDTTDLAKADPETGLIEVSGVGTGLMLIRRDVFDDLRGAHSDWLMKSGPVTGGYAYFNGGRTLDGRFVGEDYAFCDDIRALGRRIFAAPWLRIGHIGNHEFCGDPTITHA